MKTRGAVGGASPSVIVRSTEARAVAKVCGVVCKGGQPGENGSDLVSYISALRSPLALVLVVCWWCCIDARSASVSIPAVDGVRVGFPSTGDVEGALDTKTGGLMIGGEGSTCCG